MFEAMDAAARQTEDLERHIRRRVGDRVRELRQAAGLTAVELAQRAGISQGQISKIENGKAALSAGILARLCQVFERPVGYLFQSWDEMPRVLGTLNTVKGPESAGVERFADEVRRLTDGRLQLVPLRPAQIGTAAAQVDQLKDGLIDLFVEEPYYYGTLVPAFDIFALPFAFSGDRQRRAFLDSAYFSQHLEAPLRRRGVRLLNRRWNWLRGIEWVLVGSRPVVAPGDLAGLKVRIVENRLLRRFWELMGARPVAVPWAEVGAALRNGAVDVLPTHKAHLFPLGFCRHAPYVTRLGDLPPVLSVAVNEAKYQILPPDIQSALGTACDHAGDFFSRHVLAAESANEALNIRRYKAVYLQVDPTPWQERAAAARAQLRREALLDAATLAAVDTAQEGAAP